MSRGSSGRRARARGARRRPGDAFRSWRCRAIRPRTCCSTAGCGCRSSRRSMSCGRAVPDIGILVGYPEYAGRRIYNAAQLLHGGHVLANYRKACLPNYRVFDEKRYFSPGSEPTVVDFDGLSTGAADLRGQLGARAGARRARRGRRGAADHQCLALRDPQAARARARGRAARRAGADPRPVRQPGGWPGRAGVRWQFIRHGRAGAARRARLRGALFTSSRGADDGASRSARPPARAVAPDGAAGHSRWRNRRARAPRRGRASIARWCWACATTSTSTASPAWSWDCRAGWIPP